ncbi:MAG: hypothetical protein ABSG82_07780 [Sedimentisphaerales bacterium]
MAGQKQKRAFGTGTGKGGKFNVAGLLKTLLCVCVFIAVLAGFALLEGYVKKQAANSQGTRTIEVAVETPGWLNDEIKNRVYAAAAAEVNNGGDDESIAASVQRDIQQTVPWLNDARVQITHNSVRISGQWRKPIALVITDKSKFYLDTDLVVLDYVPLKDLSVVTVSGLEFGKKTPTPGEVWQGEDLAAGLAVLNKIERMDATVCPKKPLLSEVNRVDVGNFDGRRNKKEPHIVLYTKSNTQIIWGAEIGTWQRHLESPDDDKLAKLYTYYQERGTLSGVKYINLRDPRQTIYLPVDKYEK